jgi:hypothetical protein
VILLGYVIVGSSTLSDIDKYADIYRPAGIYLDGTPAEAGGVSTVKNYVSHARSKGFNFVSNLLCTARFHIAFPNAIS